MLLSRKLRTAENIIHVITTLERGGAEKQLLMLSREQVILGRSVTVLPLKGKATLLPLFERSGVKVDISLLNRNPVFQLLLLFVYLRSRYRNFIAHAHLPRSELILALSGKKKMSLVTKHNAETFLSGRNKHLSRALSHLVFHRTSITVCISHAVKTVLFEREELPQNPTNIGVIYYGFEWGTKKPAWQQNYSASRTRVKLITVSRLVLQKNLTTMLKMVKQLQNMGYSTDLQILGVGPEQSSLNRLSNQLGISQSVNFLGEKEDPTLFIREADVFILTSLYEGFGLVLLEAMDVGIPIVASRISAIPEVLGNDYPFLAEVENHYDFATKVSKVVSEKHYDLFSSYYQVAKEKYSIRRITEQTLELYDSLSNREIIEFKCQTY